jgi:hypothetical protein
MWQAVNALNAAAERCNEKGYVIEGRQVTVEDIRTAIKPMVEAYDYRIWRSTATKLRREERQRLLELRGGPGFLHRALSGISA